MAAKMMGEDGGVPEACTLPTVDRPLRQREFDELFSHDVVDVVSESADRVRLDLCADPEVASRAASLAVREAVCCSFFRFDLAVDTGGVSLTIRTSAGHEDVVAALRGWAESRVRVRQ